MNTIRTQEASHDREAVTDMTGRLIGYLSKRPAPHLPGQHEWLITDGVYCRVVGRTEKRGALERIDGLARRAARLGRRGTAVWW